MCFDSGCTAAVPSSGISRIRLLRESSPSYSLATEAGFCVLYHSANVFPDVPSGPV